jgi:outer membrane receptor for ferrienterochelin and colicins
MQRLFILFILVLSGSSLHAQVRLGFKDSQTGKGIDGVSVTIKGSVIAVSDENGDVTVSPEQFPVTITSTHISFVAQEIEISGPGDYTINLISAVGKLEEVVVTGQFEPQSVSKSVFRVRTITSEMLTARGATRLQDALNTELNFRFSTDPSLGVSNIQLQGLTGQNVKILIDGIPVVGRQGTSNAVDLNQINVNTVERVEIVEGPMSTQYGADALAGVINIITKKPEQDKLSGSVRVHEENIGDEYSFFKKGLHQENLNVQYKTKSLYALADFGHYYSGGWQGDTTGREKTYHPKKQWLASSTVGVEHDTWKVHYRLDFLNEDIYNPAQFSGNEALDQHYLTTRYIHQVQGMAALSDRLSVNAAVAYTDYQRKTQTITVNAATGEETLAIGEGLQDVTRYDGITLRGTLQYKISKAITLQPGYDINTESASGGRLAAGTNKLADYALFLSAEIQPFSFLTIRPGFRFVKNSVYDAPPVLPSVNTRIKLSATHDLRLSYGRGFRAPSLRELYFYFYDSNHAIDGNPNLEAELSHSFNASWNWQAVNNATWAYTFVLNGFYNHVDNMIESIQRPGGTANEATFGNISNFKSQGVTLVNTVTAGTLTVTAGAGVTGRYNIYYEGDKTLDKFTWSPEANASVSYLFKGSGLTTSLYYKFTGKTPVYAINESGVYLAESEAYHWADMSFQKTFLKQLNVALGVRNLFDVTRIKSTATGSSHAATGANPLSAGRSYYTTLTFNF